MTDSNVGQILRGAAEIVIVFVIAFIMKQLKYCDQNTAKKVIEAVVLYLVPMSNLLYVPRVQFQLEWMVLFFAPLVYGAVTIPLIRQIIKKTMPGLQRHERGQFMLCCTGHANTLVGYPILRSIYGEEALPLCATWDVSGIVVAYISTYFIAALYARCESAAKAQEMDSRPTMANIQDVLIRATSTNTIGPPLDPVLRGHGPSHLIGFEDVGEQAEATPDEAPGAADAQSGQASTAASSGSPASTADPRGGQARDLEACVSPTKGRGEAPVNPADVALSFAAPEECQAPNCGRVAAGLTMLLSKIIVNVAQMPVTMSFATAIAMRCFGVTTDDLPEVLGNVIEKSAACTQIMTIFGLGLFFQPQLLLQKKHAGSLAVVIGLKYGFGLISAVGTFMALGSFDIMIPMVLSIALIMPTPPVVIAYAGEYGHDVNFAALVVNASLVLSFVVAFVLAIVLPMTR